MFGKKSKVQRIIVFLSLFVFTGLIGTTLTQARNWVKMAPYNLLWPVWSEVLSPVNPKTGLPTPLVSSLTNNTVLPEQPVFVWDPGKKLVHCVYTIPRYQEGGLIYYDPEKGLSEWPPSYLIDSTTGNPLPLKLPRDYASLPPPEASTQQELILSGNYAYIEKYPNTPYESLLSPELLFPLWICYPNLPAPQLVITGTEDYVVNNQEMTRYLMSVSNWSAFPDALFAPSPDLPPCGANENASRTWVDVYSWDTTLLMGFCGLSSPESLNHIWFAVPKGEAPPECVYIELEDRRCERIYTSNCAPTTGEGWRECVDFEDPPLDTRYYVGDMFLDSGVTITLLPFTWSNGTLTYGGFADIKNAGDAGGSGQDVWTNNVNLRFDFPVYPLNGLSLKFGAYGGNQNIEINGIFKNFNDFSDIHATTIGGVNVSVINGPGSDLGILVLEGQINHFVIGGQELAIDDVCPHIEGVEIYFADGGEKPGSVYHYQPSMGIEAPIYTRATDRLYSFAFSPWNQNKLYFVNANDNKIFVQDLSGGPETVVYEYNDYISDIAFNSAGELFFSESTGSAEDGRIWRWEEGGGITLYYTVRLSDVDGFWSGDFTFDNEDTLYISSGNTVPASIYRINVPADTVTNVYTDNHGAIAGMVFGEDGLLYYANWGTRVYRLDLTDNTRTVVYVNPSRSWLSDVSFPVPEIPPTDAEGIWIMPYGIGGTRLDQIDPNGLTDYLDGISGFYMEDAPFGARLGFRLGSSSAIPTPDLTYYRFRYKHESEPEWHDFEEPVSVHYVKEKAGEPPTFPLYQLGPHDIGGKNLYEFRPHEADLPLLVPVEPGETVSWPSTGFLGDIYRGFLNTEDLHLSPGRHKIRVEVYDSDGNQVAPGAGTFDFVVPIGTSGGTILTDMASPGSIFAEGFEFTVHVDNRQCGAQIDEPTIGSVGAGDCGFLYYDPDDDPNTSPVHISFHATHPDQFALFRFRIFRGPHNIAAAYANGYEVSALSAGVYTGDGIGNFENEFIRTDLLGPCIEAAFSENLYTFAKATRGWRHRITRFDASDVRAFALTPEESELLPVEMSVPAGWSLISLPVDPPDPSVSSIFPDSVVIYGYEKGTGYVRVEETESLEVGRGYWILSNNAHIYTLTGQPILQYTLSANENGWLLIGGCSSEAQASAYNGTIEVIYGHTPGAGYQIITESEGLDPGRGYWVLLNNITQPARLTVEVR